ncbi:MAG: hypothetical protein AB7P03_14510 [Kofleriaceae bacterium]
MDPISPALFDALTTAAQDRAVGAAVDLVIDAAKVAAQKVRGLLPDGNEVKHARALVEQVLAEMAMFPPDRAIVVEPLATVDEVGIWSPRGRLKVELLWVNHADFPVRIRDVHLVGRVGDGEPEWDTIKGDEFILDGRLSKRLKLEADPRSGLPTFDRGGAQCEVTIGALVCGPWDDGRAQRTRGLVRTSLWLPVLGIEPTSLLTEVEDIDLVIKHYLRCLRHGDKLNVRYTDFDRTHGLRPGAAKERFAIVAKEDGHEVAPGPNLALVKIRYASSIAAQERRVSESWINSRRRELKGFW